MVGVHDNNQLTSSILLCLPINFIQNLQLRPELHTKQSCVRKVYLIQRLHHVQIEGATPLSEERLPMANDGAYDM